MSTEAATPGQPHRHPSHHLRARSHGRLRIRGTIAIFVVTFAVIVGIGAAITSSQAPTHHAACPPVQPCGVPAGPVGVAGPAGPVKPLVALNVFKSQQAGFSLEYDGNLLSISHRDKAGVTFAVQFTDGTTGALNIQAVPGLSPSAAIAARVKLLGGAVSQLSHDDDPGDALLGAAVGLRSGGGEVLKGNLAGPQGVSQSVEIAIESASNGRVTIIATVLAPTQHSGPQSGLYSIADQVINSVKWPAGGGST
jgi:hypothetical protein